MKKVIELVKYQLQLYFMGSKFVMPFVTMIIFLYVMYTIQPVDVVSSFLVSCQFLFFLMVWVGMSVSSAENPVMEQIVLLRVQSKGSYYASKVLFLLLVGMMADVICTGFPFIQNLLNNSGLFRRPLTGSDMINALFLQGGCAFAGGTLGSLLHPQVMRNRRTAKILTLFLAVVTICKTGIIEKVSAFQMVGWMLPPVADMSKMYGNAEYFQTAKSIGIFFIFCIYGIVISGVKSFWCEKKKF